ncbi:MAG: DUF4625 domain-containing protein [Bacteroidota bacterium]|jgi:hypothetical protein
MNTSKIIILLVVLSILLNACQDDEKPTIDTEKPLIDLTILDAFPTSCDTLYFDEPFIVKALLTDNVELGAFNIDIHNNFDHHTHSTEFEQCTLGAVKTAENPYVYIQDYTLPVTNEFTTDVSMTIPSSDGTDLYDEGDYHFQIRLTDKEGWSTMKGLNVKLLRR